MTKLFAVIAIAICSISSTAFGAGAGLSFLPGPTVVTQSYPGTWVNLGNPVTQPNTGKNCVEYVAFEASNVGTNYRLRRVTAGTPDYISGAFSNIGAVPFMLVNTCLGNTVQWQVMLVLPVGGSSSVTFTNVLAVEND